MFGKFGGIVIIALSIVIVAGLALRSVPEHPAALSLGITDTKATNQSAEAPSTDAVEATEEVMQKTAEKITDTVDTSMEKTKEVASETLDKAKDAMTSKTEELKTGAMEAIKETVTDAVESTDEAIGVVKEAVEKQVETTSE